MANIGGSALVHASAFYTFDDDGEITNGETLVIGGKTYTFQDTLTNADGNVHIGATRAETIRNLCAAVNLDGSAVAGVDYAAATTKHTEVVARAATDRIDIIAGFPGPVGNRIPVTVGTSGTTVSAANLGAGAGNPHAVLASILRLSQVNAEVLADLKLFTPEAD